MAITNAAPTATDNPAICAGVMVFGGSGAASGEVVPCGAVDVGGRIDDIESTMTVSVRDVRVEEMDVVFGIRLVEVIVAGRVEVMLMEVDAAVNVVLTTTVRAVNVGATAYFSPRQILYAKVAPLNVEHDAYMHPTATSPSVCPLELYREQRQLRSTGVVHAKGNCSDSEVPRHGCAHAGTCC